jgi:hypothetical protein
MENIISSEIDYSKKSLSYSQPLMLKQNPIGQNGATLSASSSSQIFEFSIAPSRCINLSKSKISFQVDFAALTGSGNLYTSGLGTSYLDRITISTTQTNSVLMDINNVRNYGAMTAGAFTSSIDLRDKSSPFFNASAMPILPTSANRSLAATNTDSLRLEDINMSNSQKNEDGLGIDVGSNYDSYRRYYNQDVGASTTSATFEFDLSALKCSICSLDKMLYFGSEGLNIQVYFARTNGFCFKTTGSITSSPSDVSTAVTLSNVCMYLNVENNEQIRRQLVDKVNNDSMSVLFPYPFISKTSANAPTFSTTQVVSAGYGRKLHYALTSLFSATESGNTQLDCSLSNLSLTTGYKYNAINYNTLLDSVPVSSNSNMVVRGSTQNSEQWSVNKANLKGSAYANLLDFNNRFVHIDNFCGQPCAEYDGSIDAGIPLDVNRTYSLVWSGTQETSPNLTVHNVYQAFIVQKQLTISGAGVMIN